MSPLRFGAPRLAVPVVAAGLAISLSAGAYAAWTTNGTGTATARAGASQPLTTAVAAVGQTADLLYPGGPAGDVAVTVSNPNPYPVSVSAVTQNGAVTASGGIGGCTTTGVSLAAQSGSWLVPAMQSATFTLQDAAVMTSASENGCQNATFTIPVSLTGTSA